jgi:pimeloyl-ACP methyl ester carboxylesterase
MPRFDGEWMADLPENAYLVGHPFGGAVALAAAARRPDAARSLKLIEPAAHKFASSNPRSSLVVKPVLLARKENYHHFLCLKPGVHSTSSSP